MSSIGLREALDARNCSKEQDKVLMEHCASQMGETSIARNNGQMHHGSKRRAVTLAEQTNWHQVDCCLISSALPLAHKMTQLDA